MARGLTTIAAVMALALTVSAAAGGTEQSTGESTRATSAVADTTAPAVAPPLHPTPSWVARARRDVAQEARPTASGFAVENDLYRADFAADAFAFVPKRNDVRQEQKAWRYRPATLDLGDREVALGPVTPRADDNVVEYVRPGIVERYVALPRGVEQVFVIGARPAAGADLVVRGQVTTQGAGTLADGVLTFTRAGDSPLTYSRPIAFDANRAPLPVATEYAGGELRLRIPADALRDAAFPVTIDPILSDAASTYAVSSSSNDAAVAYNSKRGEYLLVWSADNSGPDQLRAKRFDAAGDAIGSSFELTNPGAGAADFEPSVAYDELSDTYFVAYTTNIALFVNLARGMILNSTGGVSVASFDLSSSTATHLSGSARVAARTATAAGRDTQRFMVVWSELLASDLNQKRIVRERFSSGGGGSGDIVVTGPSTSADQPDIAYDFVADRFLVVWRDSSTSIRAVTQSGNGGSQGTDFSVTASGVNVEDPAVAYDPGSNKYLVAWTDDRGANDDHIYGQIVNGGASPSVTTGDLAIDLNTSTFPNGHPEVSAEVGGFIVVYEYVFGGTGSPTDNDTDIYSSYVTAQGDVSTTGLGTLAQDTGVAPENNDEEPFVATGHHGFSFVAFTKNVAGNDDVMKMMVLGRYTHYVHGTGGNAGGTAASDPYVFRPSNGTWYYRTSSGTGQLQYGTAGDIPVLFDLDGDGNGDLGVFRPSNGTWYVRNVVSGAQTILQYGTAGDVPVPGDYVGTAVNDFAVWRPSSGIWYVRDGASGAQTTLQFGQWGDVPVPADYDGDGKTEIGVWRPSTGVWYYVETNGTGQGQVQWGQAGDIPMQGNYVAPAAADFVVFRPSNGTWYRRSSAGSITTRQWGAIGDIPMFLDYDNDAELDLVVWRPSTGRWFILDDDLGSSTFVDWGTARDVPIGGR